jgi:prephenate dehydrogenase
MIFGILGYGRFGQLWAEALSHFGEVIIYDTADLSQVDNNHIDNNYIRIATLPEVSQADVIFIIVPISDFEGCCSQVKTFVNPNAIVVDCCSVKMYPVHIMQKIFSKQQPLVATHPLFGPDSVKKSGGLTDHKIVVCTVQCDEIKFNQLTSVFKKMGLNILTTTPEEHDKQMANSQGLVHFIGRGLAALELHPQELATPDFQALLNINKMVVNDTWQLFLDMHQYNPFAKKIRKKLIQQLIDIDNEVNKDIHLIDLDNKVNKDIHLMDLDNKVNKDIHSMDLDNKVNKDIHSMDLDSKVSKDIHLIDIDDEADHDVH